MFTVYISALDPIKSGLYECKHYMSCHSLDDHTPVSRIVSLTINPNVQCCIEWGLRITQVADINHFYRQHFGYFHFEHSNCIQCNAMLPYDSLMKIRFKLCLSVKGSMWLHSNFMKNNDFYEFSS